MAWQFTFAHLSHPCVVCPQVVLIQKVEISQSGIRDSGEGGSLLETNRVIVDRIKATFGDDVIDYEEADTFSRAVRTALFYCCDVLLHTPVQEVVP